MSAPELAELLGVPLATVYKWVNQRTSPPAYRVGRFLRFDPEQVDLWVSSRRVV